MPAPIKSGPEFLINTTTLNNQNNSTITALADGRFVVSWQDISQTVGDTSNNAVRAQVFNADGTPTGFEFVVNSTVVGDQTTPAISALADGGFVATWVDNSLSGGDASFSGIRAQVFTSEGLKSGLEFLVNTATALTQNEPAVTTLSDGRFVISWTDFSETSGDNSDAAILAQVFNADGSKSGGEFQVNTAITVNQLDSSLTALQGGGFVITWTDQSQTGGDTTASAVRAQVFNSTGNQVGGEILVNTATASSQSDPAVTALAGGGFVVAWADNSNAAGDNSSTAIRAQRFDATGAKAGAEFVVPTTIDFSQSQPAITTLADGRFVVSWTDASLTGGDTSVSSIRAQVFNDDGSKSGDEFRINTTILQGQLDSAITALADGRFAVSWTDQSITGADNSGSAVRGQIFDPRVAGVTLGGTALNDQFVGTGFDDVLSGGIGADTMTGGIGNDTYTVDNINDIIRESIGQGVDAVSAGISFVLGADQEVEVLKTTDAAATNAINLTGNDLAQAITGNVGNNRISGLAGNDTLTGSGGNDRLLGSDGADRMSGGNGTDRLSGGNGQDVLAGGKGADTIAGGLGADDFVYASKITIGNGATRERITDFQHKVDDIDLSAFMDGGRFIGAQAFTGRDDQVRYVKSSGLLQGDVNGDGRADWSLIIANKALLTAGDFIF